MSSILQEIQLNLASGYPLIYFRTAEEGRARKLWTAAAAATKKELVFWSSTDALESASGPASFIKALSPTDNKVAVLLDVHPFLSDPLVIRLLRDRSTSPRSRLNLVLVSPLLVLPPELEKDLALIDLPLPSREELEQTFHQICDREQIVFPKDFEDRVVRAAQGLTINEAIRVFTKALKKGGGFKLDDVALILEEKRRAIHKSEALEYFDLDENLGNVGGLEEVKKWVKGRSAAFDEAAQRYGLPPPKGLLLVGVQGCGKSLMAKAVAGSWHLPLLRLDLGAVFGSNSPELAIHQAVLLAESLAPVVLWVDEIEKGFSDENGAVSGRASRVFGSFVTWLQEKKLPVFVVATANEVSQLPPELLRKGRFDEAFFVDLPDEHERQAILKIHLIRRGRKPERFDLTQLSSQTEHYSGAELEQGIVAGMYRAFGKNREVETKDIALELGEIVPLYTMYEEKIKALREWAKTRARRANLDQSLVDLFEGE